MPCRLALARSLCALLGAAALGACSSNPAIPVLYRVEVQQGNVVTQDMLDRLEPGMDKRKVRFVLGTPLIEDTFNPDRWDYYYSFQDRRKSRTQRRVTLYFEDNQLARIEGDVLPGARGGGPRARETRPAGRAHPTLPQAGQARGCPRAQPARGRATADRGRRDTGDGDDRGDRG
jgi:outer membrane protein assembly factor BamE